MPAVIGICYLHRPVQSNKEMRASCAARVHKRADAPVQCVLLAVKGSLEAVALQVYHSL